MARMMAVGDLDSERRQPRRGRTRLQITSAHREAQPQAKLRDAAHSGAADADEMKPSRAGQKSVGNRGAHALASAPATSKQMRAICAAASGRATERARRPIS